MKASQKILSAVIGVTILFSFCSCTSSGGAKPAAIPPGDRIDGATLEMVQTAPRLSTAPYTNIVLRDFNASAQLEKDYPDALTAYKTGLISMLRGKNSFAAVDESPGRNHSGRTLLVDSTINDMRIASAAARTWGGAFAGSSFMDILVILTDAKSNKIIHKKIIASSNNAFAASWGMGSSDQSLPMDMGKITGEYIYTIVPGEK